MKGLELGTIETMKYDHLPPTPTPTSPTHTRTHYQKIIDSTLSQSMTSLFNKISIIYYQSNLEIDQ